MTDIATDRHAYAEAVRLRYAQTIARSINCTTANINDVASVVIALFSQGWQRGDFEDVLDEAIKQAREARGT